MSSSSGSAISVPNGNIGLVLLHEDSSFYLQIPLDIIQSLCLKPAKYLLFLSWSILGVGGALALEHNGDEIDTDEALDDQGIYYFVASADLSGTFSFTASLLSYAYYLSDEDLAHAVDLEVIKVRTEVSSESERMYDEFRTNLLERDTCCVWTGIRPKSGAGMHIIPLERGSEWFQLIVANRPHYGENVTNLNDINDIRNGVFALNQIHSEFDSRRLVILKTPNLILGTQDIPPSPVRDNMPEDVTCPRNSRYTLQWLDQEDPWVMSTMCPNNSDAAFKKYTRKPKPSELLLHYNYGAAAVKNWGHGVEVFQNRANPPRPLVPIPAPMGPSRATHDRTVATHKRDVARAADGDGAGNAIAGPATGGLGESEGQEMWDEDDVMLFFWGNSPAAKERHLKKVDETTRRMEQWREGVPRVSVA